MKIRILLVTSLLAWFGALALGAAPLGTAFTYQGRLNNSGGDPATGLYDFQIGLCDTAGGSGPLMSPLTRAAVPVTNGLFTVALDFGAVFDDSARWLEIAVRTNGVASFSTLSPRQPLTPAPQASYAATSSATPWSGLTGVPAGFADGVDNDTTYAASVGLTLVGTNFGLDTAYTDARYWKLGGNAGTTPGTHFLGTTDNQPVEIKANNVRVLRLEPNLAGPNVIGGAGSMAAGVWNSTIGGGDNIINTGVGSAVIAGGSGNIASAGYAAMGGGYVNQVMDGALGSTIGGGYANQIQLNAQRSVIGGGEYNVLGTNVESSAISGGAFNAIYESCRYAFIGGGQSNRISDWAWRSAIVGGAGNAIQTANWAGIGGGSQNTIRSGADATVIGGGRGNLVSSNATDSVIAGASPTSSWMVRAGV